MSARRTAYISHPSSLAHEMGAGHPEQPARVSAIEDRLKAAWIFDFLEQHHAQPVAPEQLVRAHTQSYLEGLAATAPTEEGMLARVDPDTAMNQHTLEAASHAAGAAVQAVDLVLGGSVGAAFCNVRPPGHHAEREQAMGFCFYNNVAIGALHALEAHGLQRVAVVDFDVHYGNGTADILGDDPRVLLCSSYQYPLYPLAGPARETASMSNITLRAGDGGDAFREAVTASWFPALKRFAPELILFSAGFDAHAEDPLAELRLVEDDYAWVTREILRRTRASAGLRAVSTLEGGYDLSALGRAATVHIQALMEPDAGF